MTVRAVGDSRDNLGVLASGRVAPKDIPSARTAISAAAARDTKPSSIEKACILSIGSLVIAGVGMIITQSSPSARLVFLAGLALTYAYGLQTIFSETPAAPLEDGAGKTPPPVATASSTRGRADAGSATSSKRRNRPSSPYPRALSSNPSSAGRGVRYELCTYHERRPAHPSVRLPGSDKSDVRACCPECEKEKTRATARHPSVPLLVAIPIPYSSAQALPLTGMKVGQAKVLPTAAMHPAAASLPRS